jgi:hypothetical protein
MLLTLLQSGGVGPGVITGSMAAVESGSDSLSAAGRLLIHGSLAATESGLDIFAASGTSISPIFGTMAAVESGPDVMAASGFIFNDGDSSKSVRFAIRQFVADNPSRNLTARRNAGLITRRRGK